LGFRRRPGQQKRHAARNEFPVRRPGDRAAALEVIPMRATAVVFAILVLAAAAFMYKDRLMPRDAAVPPAADTGSGPAPVDRAAAAAAVGDAPSIEKEAEYYISKLTESDPDPLSVESADHFITKDQMIALLPADASEVTTREALEADPSMSPDTPITVVREVEQVEITTPERIIAEAEGDLDQVVRVLEDGKVKESTAREVLEQYRKNPDKEITIVKDVEYYEITTLQELAENSSIEADEKIKVIRKPYRLESASVADLLEEREKLSPDTVFYVRTVRPTDKHGIWGIVHDGIIKNFARGMALRRGEEINTYRVEIPRDADEKLEDESSSFLGRMIYDKTMRSYVYNFKRNRMGQNPDFVAPGQEIVIINFEPDELIRIYKHFTSQQG
jgi:hypothetical protein